MVDEKKELQDLEIIIYQDAETDLKLELQIDGNAETIWATQDQIAELFEKDTRTVSEHIKNIYKDGELIEEATLRKFRLVRDEGGRRVSRDVSHYNLDLIISVGYRVSSQKATKFRQAATKILKTYITEGYVLNEEKLKQDPEKLNDLAKRIRELRHNEKNLFEKTKDCFVEAASDYNSSAPQSQRFFIKLQDKFIFAATEKVASQIKLERANHQSPQMGLTTLKGKKGPTKQDVQVAKNYLSASELYTLHIISEQFLLYAESKAIRGQKITMDDLANKFDNLLEVTEYPVLKEYPGYIAKIAQYHAENERALYQKRLVEDEIERSRFEKSKPKGVIEDSKSSMR